MPSLHYGQNDHRSLRPIAVENDNWGGGLPINFLGEKITNHTSVA